MYKYIYLFAAVNSFETNFNFMYEISQAKRLADL